MSLNRIVALLTPLAATLAGAITAWVAQNFPGVDIPGSALEEIFIGGALTALAPAAQWLHGWQKFEARQAEAETAVALGSAMSEAPAVEHGFDEFEDIDALGDLDGFDDFEDLGDELFADEEPAQVGG